MDLIKSLMVYCDQCDSWSPSEIGFGDYESFNTTVVEGNYMQCNNCLQIIQCNKENMKLKTYKGGYTGLQTK